MPTTLSSTYSKKHPMSVAQLGDVAVIFNGHDEASIYDTRSAAFRALGMAAPSSLTAPADGAAGLVNGTVLYRYKWYDSSTNTYSLSSASQSHTTSLKTITITRPSSPPARATHWIVERTVASGTTFYPVNLDTTSTSGTAIGTTSYSDNVADTTLNARLILPNNQGIPRRHQFCWANGANLFAAGKRVHTAICTTSNGSANVSSSDGQFTSDMVGEDFSIDADTNGVTYKIATVTSANAIVLATNYGGDGATTWASITSARNLVAWCEAGQAESWGATVVGGVSNEVLIGEAGEALTAGVGLGQSGCLLCSTDHMYLLSYRYDPQGQGLGGDGQIVPLRSRRGALGFRCVANVNGVVYGMDQYGVWASTGGEPHDITKGIKGSWRALDFSQRNNFWIGYDPTYNQLSFFVVESGQTYPNTRFVYDLDRADWIGTKPHPTAAYLCGVTLPDSLLSLRLMFFQSLVSTGKCYAYFDQIGTTLGAPPTGTIKGTATAGTATTITDSGASFTTAGEGLKGVPVTIVRASNGSEETRVILSNTATVLTTTEFAGVAPTATDAYKIGGPPTRYITGRLSFGDPVRKKYVNGFWLWVRSSTTAVDLKVRCYYNGAGTATNYASTRAEEDGVSYTASRPDATINPGATSANSEGLQRYWVDCPGDKWLHDLQIEIRSIDPGTAWELVNIAVDYNFDESGRVHME